MGVTVIPLSVTLAVLIGGQTLLLVFVALIATRKVRRDRRERGSVRRRAELAALLHGGDEEQVLTAVCACRRSGADLADLVYVLSNGEQLGNDRRALLKDAAQRGGLAEDLSRQLSARGPAVRGRAVLALASVVGAGCEARIAELLRDADADVRLAACGALALVSTEEAARGLIDALKHAELPPARIVERLGGAWAALAVCAALKTALGPEHADGCAARGIRAQLADALAISGWSAAEPEVLELLARGDDEERIAAARALGRLGGVSSIPPLIEALHAPDNWPLRAQAARALGRLGAEEASRALSERLTDQAWWVRKPAARALRRLGPTGIAELNSALALDDRYARERAAEELRLEAAFT